MTLAPSVRFERIREHAGSQHRAWEELTYQLAHDLDDLPPQVVLTRRGTPDGGIEFHCEAPTGDGIWAWQAKYLFDLKPATFKQMGDSFKDALKNTPGLTRYAFVLPIDRPAGEWGESAMAKWNQYSAQWRALAAERGAHVELVFHGHSAVLKSLLRPHNSGVARYFFDASYLTQDALSAQVDRAVSDLGPRYDPDLNVATDFPELIAGLCVDDTFLRSFDTVLGTAQQRLRECAAIKTGGDDSWQPSCRVTVAGLEEISRGTRARLDHRDPSGFPQLAAALERASTAVAADRDSWSARKEQPGSEDAKRQRFANHSVWDTFTGALSAIEAAGDWLHRQAAQAANLGVAIVVGAAGSGKSHSLADVCLARSANNAPTILILGNHLSINTSLAEELARFARLGDWRELLSGLQIAAKLTATGRALIAVDAINEGAGEDLWRPRLAGLLRELENYPEVALLLSVRTTYANALLADVSPERYVRLMHRGLVGRENEAIQRYATHYGLSVPDVPPLHPEFSNPLLLRSICRAAQARGLKSLPTPTVGDTWLFGGLLEAANLAISDRKALDRDPSENVTHRAVEAIAALMLERGSETLPLAEARELCRVVHQDHGKASASLLSALEREGLILRETGGRTEPKDRIRFTYQRMSDHLRAQALLALHESAGSLAQHLPKLIGPRAWGASGLLEALSSLVPDRYSTELIELDETADWTDWVTDHHYELAQALLASLGWRTASTVNERTTQIIRDFVGEGVVDSAEWLSTLLSLACVPDHPLNVRYLHARLHALSLIERDMAWTVPLHWIWLEEDNPIARTIDWTWGLQPNLDATARLNAMLLMSWLLTSGSRRLRDSATKVLIELTGSAPKEFVTVLEMHRTVNDPYVRERLLAVAFGFTSRLPLAPAPDVRTALVDLYQAAVKLASDSTHPPHVLVTHYMHELKAEVERRVDEALPSEFVEAQTEWPLVAASHASLAGMLGCPGDRYLANSPLGYDFSVYNLERGLRQDFVPPDQPRLRRRRKENARRRYNRAINKLAKLEGKRVASIKKIVDERKPMPLQSYRRRMVQEDFYAQRPKSALERLRDRHPETVRTLEQAAREMRTREPVRLDQGVVERWIIERVLALGWTPTSAGGPDRHPISDAHWHGTQDKIERLGKKYSWIAYHELLAVLSQHCLVSRWNDEEVLYDNVWQLSYVMDIDPTITIRGDGPRPSSPSGRIVARTRDEDHRAAWWLTGFESPLAAGAGNDEAWLHTNSDLFDLRSLLRARDPRGDEWIVLESHVEWQADAVDAPYNRGPHRRDMWARTQSYLMPKDAGGEIRAWSHQKNWMGLWMRTPPDYGTGHYRQYPHASPWREWFAQSQLEHLSYGDGEQLGDSIVQSQAFHFRDGWFTARDRDFPQYPIALATFGRNHRPEKDMSSKEMPTALLPSPLLIQVLNATQTPTSERGEGIALRLGKVEHEYSWQNQAGIVMFATGGSEWGDPSALFVKAKTLFDALEARRLGWWTWVLGEKIVWQYGEPTANRLDIFGAAGLDRTGLAPWSLDSLYTNPASGPTDDDLNAGS